MNEEKTQQPTPRKLKKAKEKGEGPFSNELSLALILAGGVALFYGLFSLFAEGFFSMMTTVFATLGKSSYEGIFWKAVHPLIKPTLFFLGGIFCITLGTQLLQRGWHWTWKKPGKRKSSQKFHRFLFMFLKLGAISFLAYFHFRFLLYRPRIETMHSISSWTSTFFKFFFLFSLEIILVLLLFGIFDFFYQKMKFMQMQRMTEQEVKEEKRETEGNIKVKEEIRRRTKNS